MPSWTLDHLVYAVPDLDMACAAFADRSGVDPHPGGVHPGRGTRNALVALGPGAYLEIIGPHPDLQPGTARWMAVDEVENPVITRWAVATDDLTAFAKTLHTFDPQLGQLSAGQRQTADGRLLSWSMTLPSSGPLVDIIPFGIDWSGSELHPSATLPTGISIQRLRLGHPNPARIRQLFDALGLDTEVTYSPTPHITAELITPRGTITL